MSTALQTEDLAFESLYRLHRPPVYAYALATMRHSADAEDVTQTTFLNAYCALHRGVAPRDDLQWLLAIARNVCRDRFRDAKRRPKEEPLDDWAVLTQPEQPEFTVGEICKEISELSPRYRQILLLREFEGRSYSEISARLGVSEAAVQTLLARARRSLRDELELGMTCSQARRVSLRHLNGVALRDERRALQRHLRRCADCSTFVGRAPRTPVARMLWLVWMPYRRIMGIFAATSAPAGSTAGGASALAAKVLTVAVVGGATAGVTAREVADAPTVGHGKSPPSSSVRVSKPHNLKPLATAAVATTWASNHLTSGRAAVTPASHHATHRLPRASSTTDGTPGSPAPTTSPVVPAAPAEATPAAPAATSVEAPPAVAPPQGSAPSASSGTGAVDAGPASANSGSAAADSGPTASADATSGASGAPNSTSGPDTGTADATPATPDTILPLTSPSPTAHENSNTNNGNGNAVGQGGTPPGQLNKPDPPAHGRG